MKVFVTGGTGLVGLAVVVGLWVVIPLIWNDLYRANLHVINWFPIAIWIFMTALLCWDVRPARDLALAVLDRAVVEVQVCHLCAAEV